MSRELNTKTTNMLQQPEKKNSVQPTGSSPKRWSATALQNQDQSKHSNLV